MTSDDIIEDLAKPIADTVCRQKAFLYRLRERMEKRGISHNDKLYLKVDAAYRAVFDLWLDLHYRSCGKSKYDNIWGNAAKPTDTPRDKGTSS